MKFKTGDKVKIRPHKAGRCGGTSCTTFESYGMGKFVGKVATIKYAIGIYKIDIDFGDWNWSDCMFSSVEKPKMNPVFEDIARLKIIRNRLFNGGIINTSIDNNFIRLGFCSDCYRGIKKQYEVSYIKNGIEYKFVVNLPCKYVYIFTHTIKVKNEDFETFIKIFKTK